MEACWAGGRGREERVWMLLLLLGGGGEERGGEEGEGWRQVFVRWILGSRDEEGGREVRRWGEEREELFVDVDAQGADGEDVAAEVEFAGLEGGEEEGGVDVGLDDEVAELGGHDAVVLDCRGCVLVGLVFVFGVWIAGFPFLEDGEEFCFAAEESDAVPTIAHAGLEDPPLTVLGGKGGVVGEAFVEFVGFEEGVVEEFGVVELDV